MIPSDIIASYPELNQSDILDAVEMAVIKVLTNAFQMPFTVTYTEEEGLKMTGLPMHGEPVEINQDKIGKKLKRHVLYTVENELQRRQTVYEAERLRQLQGKVLRGGVIGYDREGGAVVEMELSSQFQRYILLGTCPRRRQPEHERGKYKEGESYSWYVTSVLPIANHRQAKVRIRLSRTSMELPAILLRQRSGIDRIICCSRIPGGTSEIVTNQKIPKEVINSVGKETGDIYRVRIVQ